MSDRDTSTTDPEPAGTPDGPAKPRPDEPPEFGPSGYLPERASKRARKIVLRAPLGIEWVIASAVAGVVLLAAGVLFLRVSSDGPQPPYVEVAPLAELEAAQFDPELDALVLAAGGRVRAFADAADVRYCDASNRLESPDGRVWSLTGRGLGTESLAEHPTVVHDGIVFVDPTRSGSAGDASAESPEPACS